MTYHSMKRATERAGLCESAAEAFIRKAESRGLGAEELPPKERKYMEKLKRAGSYPVYYGGYLFILGEERKSCITMYGAPAWFLRTDRPERDHGIYIGKTYVRNPKKYRRLHPETDPGELYA